MFMFGRRSTTVGLDIGSGLIKAAVIEHGRGGPVLTRVVITPLASDAIVDGEVMDALIVSEAVQATVHAASSRSTQVVAAVGGRDVIIKKIKVDRAKEQNARDLVRWEAEQHVPFDMESVELDFQVLDPDADGLEMSVLLVAAKRDLIENKLRVLTDAGLTAGVIDVDAIALHNAFEFNYPDAMRGLVALVNVGHEVTNINIVEDGVPLLTRDIPIGTRRLSHDLQRESGLDANAAERLITGGERSPQLDALVVARATEIAVGVERAAAFLASASRATTSLRELFVCGGGSRVVGLADALGERLRLEVTRANPFVNLRVRDGALDALDRDDVAPLLMVPVGLALREIP